MSESRFCRQKEIVVVVGGVVGVDDEQVTMPSEVVHSKTFMSRKSCPSVDDRRGAEWWARSK